MLCISTKSLQSGACILRNPADNVLKELKKELALRRGKRRALTLAEQDLFLRYLKESTQYRHWYPVFAVLNGTGLRVGEAVGLRWCDIDLEQGTIDVNHTLVYYRHAVNGCYCNVHTPKTVNGIRYVPMLSFVKEAFIEECDRQRTEGIQCAATVDGYTDFIFLNRNRQPQHQGTLNKALRRITRDCNQEQMARDMLEGQRKIALPAEGDFAAPAEKIHSPKPQRICGYTSTITANRPGYGQAR